MKDVIITVDKKARTVKVSPEVIGIEGENKQGQFIVEFADGFVNGDAVLDVRACDCNKKGYIPLIKDRETYKCDILSSLTCHTGRIDMQVKITQAEDDAGHTPVYKSVIFAVKVDEAINATEELTE